MGQRDSGRSQKSWRDIDAARDRSRGLASPSWGKSRASRDEDRASKQHRAALEALFAKGELGKLVEKLERPEARVADKAPAAPEPVQDSGSGPARTAVAAPVQSQGPANPRAMLRKKVLEAVGREQISRAVDKLVELHGLPADFEVLEQTLEHQREERVSEAIDLLAQMLEKEKPRRSRALAGKLRFLEETSHNAELRQRAAAIRSKLG